MKLFEFAIASVVDANTSYIASRHQAGRDYHAAELHGRRIRAKTIIALLGKLNSGINGFVASLQTRAAERRAIQQLANLSDRHLEDIGLTRGDVIALQTGQIDAGQLEARRISNLGDKRIQFGRQQRAARNAINDAVFARAKCA